MSDDLHRAQPAAPCSDSGNGSTTIACFRSATRAALKALSKSNTRRLCRGTLDPGAMGSFRITLPGRMQRASQPAKH